MAQRKNSLTKAELIKHTRKLYEEAYRADPYYMDEVTQKVVGGDVFVWDNLTTAQLHALGRAGMMLRLMATDDHTARVHANPRHLTREEFDRRYWKSEGPDKVPASIRREFYSDYKESGLSFAEYVRQTTAQANPRRRKNSSAIPKATLDYADLVRGATGRKPSIYRVTKLMIGGALDGMVVDDHTTGEPKFAVGKVYGGKSTGGKYKVLAVARVQANPRRRKNGSHDALSAGGLDRNIAALEAREKKLRKQAAAPGRVPGRVRMRQEAEHLAHEIAEMKAELARRLSRSNPRRRRNSSARLSTTLHSEYNGKLIPEYLIETDKRGDKYRTSWWTHGTTEEIEDGQDPAAAHREMVDYWREHAESRIVDNPRRRVRKNGPTLDRPSYPFAEMEERYAGYTDDQLAYALKDAREAARNEDAMAKQGHPLAQYGWYADDVHTIGAEIMRRRKAKARRANPAKRNSKRK
jgi:hypothetical protein